MDVIFKVGDVLVFFLEQQIILTSERRWFWKAKALAFIIVIDC